MRIFKKHNYMTGRRLQTAACLSLVALTLVQIHRAVHAAEPIKITKGREWAILIGVEKYYKAPNLLFTVNDVEQLAKTLRQHGGYCEDHILTMVDTAPNERFQPLKKSILAELPRWLAKPGPDDLVLVYFSGHGFRDPNRGTLYLAPLDCDPKNPASGGVAVQWLREQLAQCKAETKLLILDACHAGGEKGCEESPGVSAKDLGAPFEDVLDVVTLASSTSNEKSLIWGEMRQSLFSFWLNQALKGHADCDANRMISIDELYDFVQDNVKKTAAAVFRRSQQPVRIVRSETLGVPEVVRLTPYTLAGALEDMAEQLAATIRLNGSKRVGIAQFSAATTDPKLVALLHNGPCLLGRQCAQDLERRLKRKTHDKFEVVAHDALHKALGDERLSVADLRTSAIKGITVEGQDVPVIVMGQFCARTGQIVTLQCQLIGTDEQEVYGAACGAARLNPSEWAMLGRSAAIITGDWHTPANMETLAYSGTSASLVSLPAPRPGRPSGDAALVAELDRRAEGPPPPQDPQFPFRVKILVDGEERQPLFKGNEMFVPLSRGETYSIRVESNVPAPVFMRLLVDGLNTLPDIAHEKGISVEPDKPAKDKYLPAQRVNLADARAWQIDPKAASVVEVGGFLIRMEDVKDENGKTTTQARLRKFKVTDAPQSLAAQQGFTDQLGIITAAFYCSCKMERRLEQFCDSRGGNLGTTFGKADNQPVEYFDGELRPGELIGVVHIHYVDAKTIKELQ